MLCLVVTSQCLVCIYTQIHHHNAFLSSVLPVIPHFPVLTIWFFTFLTILHFKKLVNNFFCLFSLFQYIFRCTSSPKTFLIIDVFFQSLSQMMAGLRFSRLGHSNCPSIYNCAPNHKWHTLGTWWSHQQTTFFQLTLLMTVHGIISNFLQCLQSSLWVQHELEPFIDSSAKPRLKIGKQFLSLRQGIISTKHYSALFCLITTSLCCAFVLQKCRFCWYFTIA